MQNSYLKLKNSRLSKSKGGRATKANIFIFTCIVLVIFSYLCFSQEQRSVKGKVTSINFVTRTIKIGNQDIQAPKAEFGNVPIDIGGTYRLLDSGRPAEVEVGDEVLIKYMITDGKKMLSSMTNYSHPAIKPAQKDKDFELLESSLNGELGAVDSLLQKGIDPNAKDKAGRSALMFASWGGNIEVVKALIGKGADLNAKDNDGRTALLFAAIKGYLNVVKFLVENYANVDPRDYKGAVPSNKSEKPTDTRSLAENIFKSMEASQSDHVGVTPLMCAKKEGHDEVVKFLFSRGALDVDISDLIITIPIMIVPKK